MHDKTEEICETSQTSHKTSAEKSNREKLDEQVLNDIQRNHAASDLALNQRQICKRLSLPMKSAKFKENVTKLVSQEKINIINPKHRYAASDLALIEKKLIKGYHYL